MWSASTPSHPVPPGAERSPGPRPCTRPRTNTESPCARLKPSVRPRSRTSCRRLGADAIVVVAYGLILPKAVLDVPRFGCLNVHASLLPRWRGAAPIQRALLAGDTETGISIMLLDEGLDTGPVVLQHAFDLAPGETAGTLHDRLADLGAALIVQALAGVAAGRLAAMDQRDEGA